MEDSESDSGITYESLIHLEKIEDLGDFVEILLQLNALRKQGMMVKSREEVPETLANLRGMLEIKENEAKKVIHELSLIIEKHARMRKGEGAELLEEVPEEVRTLVKKGLVRMVKCKLFGFKA